MSLNVAVSGCPALAWPHPMVPSGSSEVFRGLDRQGGVRLNPSLISLCSRARFRNLLLYLLSGQYRRGQDKYKPLHLTDLPVAA